MHDLEVNLPHASLSDEINIACESKTWSALWKRLTRDAPDEACAFVLTRPSRGTGRTTCILREIIWPEPGEVVATPVSLELSADYISRAMDVAIDAGDLVGLTLVHTHPETRFGRGRGRFSSRDDWYEARLFPTIIRGRLSALSASLVMGSEPTSVDARVWWNDGLGYRTQPAHTVRVVGPEITFLHTPYSRWEDHADPEMMDRSTRLWGAEGRRVLQNLRVGVVGAGGTGSIVLNSLATMGVGRIMAWDGDTIKKENLHRTLGATKGMLGQN